MVVEKPCPNPLVQFPPGPASTNPEGVTDTLPLLNGTIEGDIGSSDVALRGGDLQLR